MSELEYNWISEGSVRKYNRAIEELRRNKKEVTEEAIKELYTRYGGLVLGEEPAVVEETPVRGRRGRREELSSPVE